MVPIENIKQLGRFRPIAMCQQIEPHLGLIVCQDADFLFLVVVVARIALLIVQVQHHV